MIGVRSQKKKKKSSKRCVPPVIGWDCGVVLRSAGRGLGSDGLPPLLWGVGGRVMSGGRREATGDAFFIASQKRYLHSQSGVSLSLSEGIDRIRTI
jgi:hypothetical protein